MLLLCFGAIFVYKLQEKMYKRIVLLFLLLSAVLLPSCGGGEESSACAGVYEAATAKVMQATSSEELVEIAYSLHLQLEGLGDAAGRVDVTARREYELALKKREVEFYSALRSRKQR